MKTAEWQFDFKRLTTSEQRQLSDLLYRGHFGPGPKLSDVDMAKVLTLIDKALVQAPSRLVKDNLTVGALTGSQVESLNQALWKRAFEALICVGGNAT